MVAVVLLPTPPFWFAIVIVIIIRTPKYSTLRSRISRRRPTSGGRAAQFPPLVLRLVDGRFELPFQPVQVGYFYQLLPLVVQILVGPEEPELDEPRDFVVGNP